MTWQHSGLRRFWAELRRRRVVRVVALYAAVTFVVLQAADLLFPALLLPDWTFRLLAVVAVLGLPVVAVLAWAFDITPEGVRRAPTRPEPAAAPAPATAAARGSRRVVVLVVAAALVAGGALWLLGRRDAGAPGLDERVVAVLPFRTAGADPALGYLREGMVDLLSVTLEGDVGPRAVDSRTLLSRWHRDSGGDDGGGTREDALRVAAALGAGRALLGEVVGTPGNVLLTASLVRVPDGAGAGAPIRVTGPADSLAALVERLTAAVLAADVGEAEHRLTAFTATPLPALRAFLNGRRLYRRGLYREAVVELERAVEIDSSFGIAGLTLAEAVGWSSGIGDPLYDRGLRLAWADRDRLGARDRAYLAAVAGPAFPRASAAADLLEAAYAALRASPDRPEAVLWVGEHYFHWGAPLGIADWRARAADAFERAVALDSTYAPAMQHLIELASERGDTAALRRLGDHYFSLETEGDTRAYLEWRVAAGLGDTARVRAIRDRFPSMHVLPLMWIAGTALAEGRHLEDADLAVATSLEARDRRGEGLELFNAYTYLGARGRILEARRLWEELTGPDPVPFARAWRVLEAMYGDGDADRAADDVRVLEDLASAPPPPGSPPQAEAFAALSRCVTAQWDAWHERTGGLAGAVRALRAVETSWDESGEVTETLGTCARLVEAIHATVERRPDAAALVAALDAHLRTGPPLLEPLAWTANLAAARLLELNGSTDAALAAVRRRWRKTLPGDRLADVFLREEGRLAALAGDRDGAIAALTHYLALMDGHDPVLAPHVHEARTQLAALAVERAR